MYMETDKIKKGNGISIAGHDFQLYRCLVAHHVARLYDDPLKWPMKTMHHIEHNFVQTGPATWQTEIFDQAKQLKH